MKMLVLFGGVLAVLTLFALTMHVTNTPLSRGAERPLVVIVLFVAARVFIARRELVDERWAHAAVVIAGALVLLATAVLL